MAEKITELAKRLDPFIKRVSSVVTQQVIINDQNFLRADGSRELTGNLTVAGGITLDGVDLSAFKTMYDGHLGSDSHTIYASASGSGTRSAYQAERLNRTLTAGAHLSGGGLLTADISLDVNMAAAFTWTNAHVFQSTVGIQGQLDARHILPETTDTYDLGSSTRLWRKGWLSELDAIVFAKNTVALVGGWLVVGKGEGVLPATVLASATQIDFGQAMIVGDFVLFRAAGQVEYMQVGPLVSGTTYAVTRNLDGTGANEWPAGSVFSIRGKSGDGWLELNATDTPRLSIMAQGATYNAQTEQVRIGDLNGNWGYSAQTYGMGIGEYAAGKGNITADPTNGLRIRVYGDTVMQFSGGNADITGKLRLPGSSSALAIGTTPPTAANAGTGIWIDRTGFYSLASGTEQVKIDAATGKLWAGAGNVRVDTNGFGILTGDGGGNSVDWYGGTFSDVVVGRVHTSLGGASYNQGWLQLKAAGSISTQSGVVYLASIYGNSITGTNSTNLKIGYGGVSIGSNGGTASLSIGDGLYVGSSTGANPGTGAIYATGTIANTAGGLSLGWHGSPGNGNLIFFGDLCSYKNSVWEWGYIYHPLQEAKIILDGSSGLGATTTYYLPTYGIPVGAKAVQLLIGGRWTTANNSYYMQACPYGTTNYQAGMSSLVANVNQFVSGNVAVAADRITIVIGGSAMAVSYLKIVGYYI